MSVSKILKVVTLIIALVGVFFFYKVATGEEGSEALAGSVGGFISFTKILLILVAVIVAAFMVLDVIKHPSKLKKTIIGLVAFAALFGLAYVMADASEVVTSAEVIPEGSKLSKNVSTGIMFSFILGALAFFGFAFDSVKSLFK